MDRDTGARRLVALYGNPNTDDLGVLGEHPRHGRLQRLGYDTVTTRLGDGYYGWPDLAHVDSIIVTAAADHVPPPLVRQLKKGGRMVIPVGQRFSVQHLLLITKEDDGNLKTRQILPVRAEKRAPRAAIAAAGCAQG